MDRVIQKIYGKTAGTGRGRLYSFFPAVML
jgi:hypothetical protein